MTPEERQAALEGIAAEVRSCTRCRLHEQRSQAVPGEGDSESEVVFVGEGPGFNEDRQGRPFVGAAGNLLNELLSAIGWRRRDVFITNVVKCRPPENRDPAPDEIAACAPFLRRQLEVLDPAVVVTLGRHSLQTFMPGARIGAAHGTQRPIDLASGATAATAYAMYHPAAALRQGSLRRTMLEDMAGLPQVLIDARRRREATAQPARDDAVPARATAAPEAHDEAMAPLPPRAESVSVPQAEAALSVPQGPAAQSVPQPAPALSVPQGPAALSVPLPAPVPSVPQPVVAASVGATRPLVALERPSEAMAVAGPADPDNQLELF